MSLQKEANFSEIRSIPASPSSFKDANRSLQSKANEIMGSSTLDY